MRKLYRLNTNSDERLYTEVVKTTVHKNNLQNSTRYIRKYCV